MIKIRDIFILLPYTRALPCYNTPMHFMIFLDTVSIIWIAAGSTVVVIALLLILYFTVFASLRHKRQVRELSRKFEYLHALLFGQDSQYIKRIEQISTTNLLYAETHRTFAKRFKDVRDKSDSSAQTAINGLKDLLQERDYKGLKLALPEARKVIDVFDEEVNALHNDLLAVIKPEEECRQESLNLKENLRRIKQDYYVKQADLVLVYDSFEAIFKKLDAKFTEFESLVDAADYDEARDLLPHMSKVIEYLGRAITELPNICITIQTVVPTRLDALENTYQEMVKADYPLHHLMVITSMEEMKRQLEVLTKRVQAFDLHNVQLELDGILSRIDEFMDAFDKEKDDRVAFESQIDEVYAKSVEADKKYISLCNALPTVKKMYVISEEETAKVDTIKNLINQAGATKRSLDTFVHSLKKQPYSILLEKMNILRSESEDASTAIDEFHHYLLSLKRDSEAAIQAVADYYARCKEAEAILRAMDLKTATEKYQPLLDGYYELIDIIYSSLKTPINVAYINSCVEKLIEGGDATCLAIREDFEMQKRAQSVITYANRKRQHLGEVHTYLNQIEGVFWDGDYKKCFADTNEFVRQLREQ